MAATVFIVVGDSNLPAKIEQLLSASPKFHFGGAFSSSAAALKAIPSRPPDMLLVDFRLADMTSVEFILRLHPLVPELPIVIFNTELEPDLLFELLRAGAAGLLDKHVSLETIPDYLRVALDGRVALSKGIGHILAAVSEQLEGLSERERAIVSYLLAGKRQKEVATALGISERTVHTHLRRLYKKRGVRSWKSLVQKIVVPHGLGQV